VNPSAGTTYGVPDLGAVGALGEFLSDIGSMTDAQTAPPRGSIAALELEPGDAALDVGCGVGDDVRLLGEIVGPAGRAVGVEVNEELVAEARARTAPGSCAEFVVADAHDMPFADDTFDAARVERALQHMADPSAVVAEVARVVRSGGRFVALEPDWDTIVVSGGDLETTRAVARACAGQVRHPDAGRRLGEWFAVAGIELIRLEALAIPIRSVAVADQVLGLHDVILAADPPGMRDWLERATQQETENAFVAVATGFGAFGVVA
jgi:SAM-dependent methyltransferase